MCPLCSVRWSPAEQSGFHERGLRLHFIVHSALTSYLRTESCVYETKEWQALSAQSLSKPNRGECTALEADNLHLSPYGCKHWRHVRRKTRDLSGCHWFSQDVCAEHLSFLGGINMTLRTDVGGCVCPCEWNLRSHLLLQSGMGGLWMRSPLTRSRQPSPPSMKKKKCNK